MWVAALALVLVPKLELTRLEQGALAGWTALAAWTWLSSAWSKDVSRSVLEGERLLVFVAGVGALVLVARRISTSAVIGGALAGIAVVASTRLFSERLGSFDPIAGRTPSAPGRLAAALVAAAPAPERRIASPAFATQVA